MSSRKTVRWRSARPSPISCEPFVTYSRASRKLRRSAGISAGGAALLSATIRTYLVSWKALAKSQKRRSTLKWTLTMFRPPRPWARTGNGFWDARPVGKLTGKEFRWHEASIPQPSDGQVLIRNLWLSVDPAQRIWMWRDSYIPKIPIGEVMASFAVGQVLESRHPDFKAGDNHR